MNIPNRLRLVAKLAVMEPMEISTGGLRDEMNRAADRIEELELQNGIMLNALRRVYVAVEEVKLDPWAHRIGPDPMCPELEWPPGDWPHTVGPDPTPTQVDRSDNETVDEPV